MESGPSLNYHDLYREQKKAVQHAGLLNRPKKSRAARKSAKQAARRIRKLRS